jgi:glycerol uptake facilitator protein
MTAFMGEVVGTAILITLGDGVVANVVLNQSKGHNSGWIVITFGWAIAVFTGVYVSAAASGAHLNPAVTFALATLGDFAWDKVPLYLLAQLLGAAVGSTIVWLTYRQQFDVTPDKHLKMVVFCTSPSIRNYGWNLLTEILATFIFIFSILFITKPEMKIGALDALPVALLVLGIGLSLGGPTGYAINPVRDFGPRLMHFILPIRGKGTSDWSYAWIPIVGPLTGGVLAALLFKWLSA